MLLHLCSISATISVDSDQAARQQARQVDPHQFPKVLTSKDLQAILPVCLQAQLGRRFSKVLANIHDCSILVKLMDVMGHMCHNGYCQGTQPYLKQDGLYEMLQLLVEGKLEDSTPISGRK